MTQTNPKSPRWMKITLAVSLCLNFLVLGAVGGAFLKGGGSERRQMAGSDPMRGIYHALPKDVRKSLRKNIRSKGAKKGERAAWIGQFVAALRAPELDAVTIQALFSQRSERMNSIATQGHEALIKALTELSPDARVQLADDFEKSAKRRRKH